LAHASCNALVIKCCKQCAAATPNAHRQGKAAMPPPLPIEQGKPNFHIIHLPYTTAVNRSSFPRPQDSWEHMVEQSAKKWTRLGAAGARAAGAAGAAAGSTAAGVGAAAGVQLGKQGRRPSTVPLKSDMSGTSLASMHVSTSLQNCCCCGRVLSSFRCLQGRSAHVRPTFKCI
jgi:hypothetical protein